MQKYNSPAEFSQRTLAVSALPFNEGTLGQSSLSNTSPDLPTAFRLQDGSPDIGLLRVFVNSFYDKFEPSRENAKREGLITSLLEKGWHAVNEALMTKYGHDLKSGGIDSIDDVSLRTLIDTFYDQVDPSRPSEARDHTLALIKETGWDVVNNRMHLKYGRDLGDVMLGVDLRPRAPLSEPQMSATITGFRRNGANMAFKVYSFVTHPVISLVTLGFLPASRITEQASGSTITMGLGCTECHCYQDGVHFGRMSMKSANDGTWVKVPTLTNDAYQIIAQCYLAQKGCCSCSHLYVLKIVGYQTLEAPVECCNAGKLTFYDIQRNVAIEVSTNPCGLMQTIRAREDIPLYALALIPWRNANQG